MTNNTILVGLSTFFNDLIETRVYQILAYLRRGHPTHPHGRLDGESRVFQRWVVAGWSRALSGHPS
jgi:hypothetical protein